VKSLRLLAIPAPDTDTSRVNLAEIEIGIRQLTAQERRRLSAFLLALEDEDNPAQTQWVSQKLNAAGSTPWIPAEQVLRELRATDFE